MAGRCTRERWSVATLEWRKIKSVKLEFVFIFVAEIIQVLDSIAWVCCAYGNNLSRPFPTPSLPMIPPHIHKPILNRISEPLTPYL